MELDRRRFLIASAALAARAQSPAVRIVDIVPHSHADIGYTDLPSVTRDMQKRYLDAALDKCLRDAGYRWTAESMLVVDDWWRASSPQRRAQLVAMVRAGRMDVMALPFNQTPFQNAAQWRQMLAWVPPDVWNQLQPRAAMQSDVNGFPRAGALQLLDHNIRRLLMGINSDSGGPPSRRPDAFWWKMPDGRRLFVWLGEHYGTAYSWFEPKDFLRGGRGMATEFGPPRPGEVLRTTEPALRAAHAHFTGKLAKLVASGYSHPRLLISYTNQWRYDNDPPFTALSDFVAAWNRLGLTPTLRLTTASDALEIMEREIGPRIGERQGEWTDWWSNGDASGPRELAASRVAKRKLEAALSPVWGRLPASAQPDVERILKDVCLFDEHTWGADTSISQPDALETIGQYTEKSLLAYRPKGAAEWLLSRRARTAIAPREEGLYVVNSAMMATEEWVHIPERALRADFSSVQDASGRQSPLVKEKGGFRFWSGSLPPASIQRWTLGNGRPAATERPAPDIKIDAQGWPVAVAWAGMREPLFTGELGHFLSTQVVPPANRQTIARMHSTADRAEREASRAKAFRAVPATYRPAEKENWGQTTEFRQVLEHPRLRNAERRLTLWNGEPRARVRVSFDRIGANEPEVFYIAFGFPVPDVLPVLSGGGVPFTPYTDQIEGSCRDYFAFDGWAHYPTPYGDWLWVSRDAALVAVGGPHTVERHIQPPPDKHRLLAMVFDNFWHTNFVADSHGRMEFQFELVWREKLTNRDALAAMLAADPVVVLNPQARESPELMESLFRP